jgi:putative tricarboxylic transport membrane protein
VSNVKQDYIFFGIVILFAVFFLAMTPQIVITNGSFIIGPRSWPYILLTLILVLALYGIVKTYVLSKKTTIIEPADHDVEDEPNRRFFRLSIPMVSLGMVIIYVLLLNILGFIISSLLFLYVISLLLGQKNQLNSIIFAVITTGVFVVLFSVLLSIPLPRGLGIFRQLSLLFY